MDADFLRSREFVIAAVGAALVLAGGAVVAVQGFPGPASMVEGCSVSAPDGSTVEAQADQTSTTVADGRTQRTVTWTLDPGSRTLYLASLCADEGSIDVRPADDDRVRVIAHVSNAGEDARSAVENDSARVRFLDTSQGLALAVDHPHPTTVESFGRTVETTVSLEVRVPADASPMLSVRTDEGAIRLADLELDGLDLGVDEGRAELDTVSARGWQMSSDEGGIVGERLGVHGDLELGTDEGDVELDVRSVEPGEWSMSGDEGDLVVRLPHDPTVSWDVDGNSDDGDVFIRTPSEGGDGDTSSEDRGTVRIVASTDEGDIDIRGR